MDPEAKVWYVRGEDGRVYGPAALSSLVVWAQEGRIDPLGGVSTDRISWLPSSQLPELDMKWVVETAAGKFFGPYHRELVRRMVDGHSVPAGARFYRLHEAAIDCDVMPRTVDRIVVNRVEVPVEKIVEKVVEKVVEKRVEVPVEKVVEKRIEVPVEKIVEKVVVKRIEVPVEKIVEKVVVKRVEVPVEKVVEKIVEKVVEKRVEVPVEKIVEKIVEVPVERIVEKVVASPVVEMPPAVETAVVLVPEVMDDASESQQSRRVASGIFKGADTEHLAALEEAARRELASARKHGLGSFFGGRR